jgi:hypothetical protein
MRRRVLTICTAAALLVMSLSAMAATKVDFSGTWALDKSRSTGLQPGIDQTMTVKQTGDRLDIETKISGDQGDQVVKDHYILDGKETEFTPPFMGNAEAPPKGKRTSKWSADGKGFDANEQATIDGPDGAETIKVARRWQLSDDGKTLTIEMTFDGPQGVAKSKRVFAKK